MDRLFDTDKIQTFKLYDLVGRTLGICSVKEDGAEIIFAVDKNTDERFILKYEYKLND
jgi:hypothetical protein